MDLIELENVTFTYGLWGERRPDAADNPEDAAVDVPNSGGALADDHDGSAVGVSADVSADAPSGGYAPDRDNAIEDVSLRVKRGEFIAFLGRNGSGKSTLAKLLNALLLPSAGTVRVKGMDTLDPATVWEVRRTSGMVFQNPDNQIVGTTVEEDVAFGVENLGVPPREIRERIDASMAATGVQKYADRPPYQLSGGQKQRVAIAGILAMKPECVILDEATAMLDPDGRREVLNLVRTLNRDERIAVILITHHMDEVALADRVYVVDEGRVVMESTPGELFGDIRLIRSIGLDVPPITAMFAELRKMGANWLPRGVADADTAFDILSAALLRGRN